MTPRRRLVWQLGLLATGITVILGFVDMARGFFVPAAFELLGGITAAIASWLALRGRERLATSILLGTILGIIFVFDDGFAGNGKAWPLYIPFVLVAFSSDDVHKPRTALVWLLLSGIAVALVNFTSLTPRWALLTPANEWTAMLHFTCAGLGSTMCLRFLQKEQDRLLRESQELTLDLRAALYRTEQASQAKSDFLSHMSHEFRTPLNAISGFTQILIHGGASPSESAENLQAIRTSADHLVHLIGDILDLSRMEHGQLVLARTAFHPTDEIHAVHTMLLQSAREKQLTLDLEILTGCPWVEGDPVRWRQVILNLGSNAIKYTESGKVLFRLSWQPTDLQNGRISIDVVDTGPGIPHEHQNTVFQRFKRLPSHETGPIGGAGLGLSIARDLAESMNGFLVLHSSPGEGCTFSFSIPVRTMEAPKKGSSDSWERPWTPQGYRILLCEDNRLNVRLATQVLARIGVDHAVAMDGQAALDLLEMDHFDAILLDLHMPRKNGFEVTRTLRSSIPPHPQSTIPIIALTADASEETLQKTRDAGMNDFLAKPFHLPELEERLRKLLRKHPVPSKTA